MAFITKPERVKPKDVIKAETINQIIQGLEDVENYLENIVKVVEDHIEYGKVKNIPTDRTGTYTYQITFKKQFTDIPYIFLTIENLDADVDINIWVSNVTTTSFTLNVKVISVRPNTYCNVNYLALL